MHVKLDISGRLGCRRLPGARVGRFLLAGTGAYHHARASNYHLVTRPALLAVRGGRTSTLVRRESLDDLLTRDADLTHPGGTADR